VQGGGRLGTRTWWNVTLECAVSALSHVDGSWSARLVGFRGTGAAVKDYERKVQTSEILIEVAMIRLLLARAFTKEVTMAPPLSAFVDLICLGGTFTQRSIPA